jgi:hypothetical protein
MRHALGEACTNYNRALDEALERGYNMSRLGLVGRLSSLMNNRECHRVSDVVLDPLQLRPAPIRHLAQRPLAASIRPGFKPNPEGLA